MSALPLSERQRYEEMWAEKQQRKHEKHREMCRDVMEQVLDVVDHVIDHSERIQGCPSHLNGPSLDLKF
jgi:hypothetical protein